MRNISAQCLAIQAGQVSRSKKKNSPILGNIDQIFHVCVCVQDMKFLRSNMWPGGLSTDDHADDNANNNTN